MGRKSKQSKKGGNARKIGRKKRKMSFQRYWATGRWWKRRIKRVRRHAGKHPNDKDARLHLRYLEETPVAVTMQR